MAPSSLLRKPWYMQLRAGLHRRRVPDAIFQNMKAGYPAEVAKYFGTAVRVDSDAPLIAGASDAYGCRHGVATNAVSSAASADACGMQVYSIVNIVFITQSLSTLDSTFTSAGALSDGISLTTGDCPGLCATSHNTYIGGVAMSA